MPFQVTEVQKALKGADYPMDGKALSALAKKNGADDNLVNAFKGLREVDGPNTVMKELKEHAEDGGRWPEIGRRLREGLEVESTTESLRLVKSETQR
jgi:hypothetical protein